MELEFKKLLYLEWSVFMAQGLIGGMTPYGDQSLEEIQEDLKYWKEYSMRMKLFFEENLEYLKNEDYIKNIPYNLQCVFFETIRKANTFTHDIEIIDNSINNNRITKKDVTLLKNIGLVSIHTNKEYGITYHEETFWHEYGEKNFRIAEKLYQNGRDYFVTLQDASNAADRLENYMSTDSLSTTNFINNGQVTNLQQGNNNSMVIENNSAISNSDEINILLKQLLDNLDSYFDKTQTEEKNETKECIEVVQAELVSEKPKKGIIKNILKGLPAMNESVDFLAKVAEIAEKIKLF